MTFRVEKLVHVTIITRLAASSDVNSGKFEEPTHPILIPEESLHLLEHVSRSVLFGLLLLLNFLNVSNCDNVDINVWE